jgi:predicted permease
VGFYRLLLLFFLPRSFRQQYGEAMAELYAERLQDVPDAVSARLHFRVRALLDVVAQGVAERRGQRALRAGQSIQGADRRGGLSMNRLQQDVGYALRALGRNRGVSAVAVVALALGIGLTTLMFSIIFGILLRQIPLDRAEQLVELRRETVDGGPGIRIHDYDDWRTQTRSFRELGALRDQSLRVVGDGIAPVSLRGALLTPSTLRVLAVQPLLGRTLSDDDDRPEAPRVMLLGWGVWQGQFGADPGILGRTLRVDGQPTTIVGVMPRRFGYPDAQQAWLPLREQLTAHPRGEGPVLRVIARLNEGVSLERARAELETIQQRLVQAWPETNKDVVARVSLLLEQRLNPQARTALISTFGAVLFVLLIVCANVANLLIGRATMRAREVGVRTALGASRWRVMSLFLIESLVLALAGAFLGTGIAALGIRWFNAAIMSSSEPPPYWVDIRLDAGALLCVLAAALFATVAAGVIPAVQAARANTNDILKDETRGSSSFRLGRLSRVLVAGEMALSLALLVGAGLTIKGVFRLYTIDLGLDARRVFTTQVMLSDSVYRDPAARLRFSADLLRRLRAVPGLQNATLATSAPGMPGRPFPVSLEGEATDATHGGAMTTFVMIQDGFFASLGVPVRQGREFTVLDRAGALPVALVNQSFEQRHFSGQSALGRLIRVQPAAGFTPGPNSTLTGSPGDSTAPWLTIVGVVPDMYPAGADNSIQEAVYRPIAQAPGNGYVVLARTPGNPAAVLPAVRAILTAMNPDLPLEATGSLNDIIRRENWVYGVFGTLFTAFGLAALFVASVGLYAVMAFSVGQRRREMGVRKAVGATTRDIVRLVLKQGLSHAAIGMAIGLFLAFAASRLLDAVLFQVEPGDPVIFATTSTILLTTAVLACWIPARRAARADPLQALRAD